jgi:hypothetical protein
MLHGCDLRTGAILNWLSGTLYSLLRKWKFKLRSISFMLARGIWRAVWAAAIDCFWQPRASTESLCEFLANIGDRVMARGACRLGEVQSPAMIENLHIVKT